MAIVVQRMLSLSIRSGHVVRRPRGRHRSCVSASARENSLAAGSAASRTMASIACGRENPWPGCWPAASARLAAGRSNRFARREARTLSTTRAGRPHRAAQEATEQTEECAVQEHRATDPAAHARRPAGRTTRSSCSGRSARSSSRAVRVVASRPCDEPLAHAASTGCRPRSGWRWRPAAGPTGAPMDQPSALDPPASPAEREQDDTRTDDQSAGPRTPRSSAQTQTGSGGRRGPGRRWCGSRDGRRVAGVGGSATGGTALTFGRVTEVPAEMGSRPTRARTRATTALTDLGAVTVTRTWLRQRARCTAERAAQRSRVPGSDETAVPGRREGGEHRVLALVGAEPDDLHPGAGPPD